MSEIKQEYLQFLNNLESWGVSNLSPSTVLPYFRQQFTELSLNECNEVISYWASTRNQLLNEKVN